jgi:hypothetical protein
MAKTSTLLSLLAIAALLVAFLASTGDAAETARNMLGAAKLMTATATTLALTARYWHNDRRWVVAAFALNVLPLAVVVSSTI